MGRLRKNIRIVKLRSGRLMNIPREDIFLIFGGIDRVQHTGVALDLVYKDKTVVRIFLNDETELIEEFRFKREDFDGYEHCFYSSSDKKTLFWAIDKEGVPLYFAT